MIVVALCCYGKGMMLKGMHVTYEEELHSDYASHAVL